MLHPYLLERRVSPIRPRLRPIRLKIPPTPSPVKHRQIFLLPHRQFMVPRPSLVRHTRVRFHPIIPRRTNPHQIIGSVQKLRSTDAFIPSVVNLQFFRLPAVVAVIVTSLDEFAHFQCQGHAPSLCHPKSRENGLASATESRSDLQIMCAYTWSWGRMDSIG